MGAEMEGERAGAEGVGIGDTRTGALSEWVMGRFRSAVGMGCPDVGGIGWVEDIEGGASVA